MADIEPIGKALVIPNEVLSSLDKVDEKINKIAADSSKMADSFTSAMKRMSGNTDGLLSKLSAINQIISRIGGTNLSTGITGLANGMTTTSIEAEKAASSITKAAVALNKYNNESGRDSDRKAYIERYTMYQRMFDMIERKEQLAKKSAEREARAVEAAEQRKIRAQQRAYKEQAKLYREQNLKANTTVSGALGFADTANTYARRAQAIKYLEAAIKKLSTTDANYQANLSKLVTAHKRLTAQQDEVAKSLGRIQRSQQNLMNTSDQLARKLALIFSVSQITGYVNKLVQVRGEFELQNTALTSILQNKDKADKLFSQITQLAVQSPFTLKELITYTKSLSAYQVEYEKLYDTTKMLADVSAGLGVDMQRLILAFGQVKAANFLRGTETRQFTEAGINMLGELSKYYSELEGRVVSVSEVMDRQFKRMISFQDVEQVFKRLTSAGGMFYQMQERQAETLAGMMSNLKDRIDLMFNEIGKDNEGIIKDTVKLIQYLVSNWEVFADVLKASVAAFGLYKLNLLLSKQALIDFAVQQAVFGANANKSLTIIQLLEVGFLKLGKAISAASASMVKFVKANPLVLALSAVVAAIYTAVTWNDEYNKSIETISNNHDKLVADLYDIANAYDDISNKARSAADSQTEFAYSADTYKQLYAQLQKLNNKLQDEGYSLSVPLEFVNESNIDEVFASGKELLEQAAEFKKEFAATLAESLTEAELGGLIGENLKSDFEDLANAYAEVGVSWDNTSVSIINKIKPIYKELSVEAKKYFDEIEKGRKEEESDTEWRIRRLTLLTSIASEMGKAYGDMNEKAYDIFYRNKDWKEMFNVGLNVIIQQKEAADELQGVFDAIIEKYGSLENLKSKYADNPIIIRTEIDKTFEEQEMTGQAKRFAEFWLYNKLQIPIEFTPVQEMPQFFNDFRDTIKTLDTKGIFDDALSSLTDITQVEGLLQKEHDENIKKLDVLNRMNTERLDLTKEIAKENEIIESGDEQAVQSSKLRLLNLNAQKKVIDDNIKKLKESITDSENIISKIANAFNLTITDKQDKGGRSGVDRTSEIFKNRIKLITDANKEYEKYLEYMDEEAAKQQVLRKYSQTAKRLGVSDIIGKQQFDEQGTIDSLERLKGMYKNLTSEMQSESAESIGGIEFEMYVGVSDEAIDNITNTFESAMSGYELSMEFEKEGVPKDIAASLFGIDDTSLNDVQKKVEKAWIDFANMKEVDRADKEGRTPQLFTNLTDAINSLGTKEKKAFDKMQEDITKKQKEELNARLKDYMEYYKNVMGERASLIVDMQDEISKIPVEIEVQGLKDEAIDGIVKKYRDKLSKLDWEEFQNSDMYSALFNDLEYISTQSIETIRTNINKLKLSLNDLSPEQLKVITDKMNQLDDELIKRQPFKELAKLRKELDEIGKSQAELDAERITLYDKRSSIASDVADYETILGLKREGLTLDENVALKNAENAKLMEVNIGVLESMLALKKQSLKQTDDEIANNSQNISKYEKMRKAVEGSIGAINEVFGHIKETYTAVMNALDAIGVDADSTGAMFADMGMALLDMTVQAIMFGLQLKLLKAEAKLLKVEMNSALGVIGWIAMALEAVAMGITAAFRAKDNKLEKQIERQLELVENLQRAYDDLKESMDNAISMSDLRRNNEEIISNLEAQNEAIRKSIQLEEDKKKTDKDKIREWNNEIIDNQKAIEEARKEYINAVGGFGTEANRKSAAQDFVDTWLDAYLEVGDGLSALKGKMNDFLKDAMSKQLLTRLSDKYLKQIFNEFDTLFADTSEGGAIATTEELKRWVELYKESAAGFNEQATAIMEALKNAGIDISQGAGDTMSGLQKGISSITEDTAQVVASLLESVRYFTSDSNTQLRNLNLIFTNPPAENPLFAELKAQTEYMRLMYSLLNSMSIAKSGVSGRVIKVEIV